MDRWLTLAVALMSAGLLWLAWRGIKCWLRKSIRVDAAALTDDRPSLLYFYTEDCAPCRWQQKPILLSLREALGESVRFQEYDAVAHAELASRYRVLTVPTTVVVAPAGQVVAVNYGVAQAAKLKRQLAEAGQSP